MRRPDPFEPGARLTQRERVVPITDEEIRVTTEQVDRATKVVTGYLAAAETDPLRAAVVLAMLGLIDDGIGFAALDVLEGGVAA